MLRYRNNHATSDTRACSPSRISDVIIRALMDDKARALSPKNRALTFERSKRSIDVNRSPAIRPHLNIRQVASMRAVRVQQAMLGTKRIEMATSRSEIRRSADTALMNMQSMQARRKIEQLTIDVQPFHSRLDDKLADKLPTRIVQVRSSSMRSATSEKDQQQ